jgi:hypothetical protein
MTRERWRGVILIAIGFAVLIVAPRAQSCVTDFSSRVCEGAGTIVLNVVGLALVAIAAVVLARYGAASDRSGDDTR